jgi:hypothetical protein
LPGHDVAPGGTAGDVLDGDAPEELALAAELDPSREALFVAAVERLGASRRDPESVIEELLSELPSLAPGEARLVAVCRDDGTGTYYLPPTVARNRIANAELFCGALEARVGDR